eukprot:gnl/MRDRNA2_/MRDRNA2_89037_c0_seq1.p1 gnl/MRDRNA2_/MRDRNA2_89037_c0~~gnl/MRDRNA2_/MRDRNA2_89037_c0_seq1.p1  ORF type:complete len:561 (+),score=133.35 gnl/MRDRNA2_/MRDRNA2_89037_c0_seq1:52-1734(+)
MAHDVQVGHLLFEVEHHVVRGAKYGAAPSMYQVCAEAAVASIWEVMEALNCEAFTVLINRRLVSRATKGKNWVPVFPIDQERAGTPGESDELDTGNPQDVQVPARARKPAASRYPRESAFEVTVYDTERANHRVLFSKYRTHQFPQHKEDLWAPLLPLLIIFAGYSNDEPLLQRLAHFALDHNFAIDLAPKDLAPHASGGALLSDIHQALLELQEALQSGDPQQMLMALDHMPSDLRTKECLVIESKCLELGEAEDRIESAIQRIEEGFVTSGLDNLRRALAFAEQMKLSGRVVQDGKALLASLTEVDEEPEQDVDDGSQRTVSRRSVSSKRMSIRASKSVDASRRFSGGNMDTVMQQTRASILSEMHTRLYEAAKSWPFKVQVPEPRSDGATSMTEIEDFLSKVQECMVKRHDEYKAKNESAALEIKELQEALDEMQDLHTQLLEQGVESGPPPSGDALQASGSTTRSRGNTDDIEPPQRVMPGQIIYFGQIDGNSQSEPLVCFDCANAQGPDSSPEELAELRLQTKLLTERCRDLKAQLKSAKEMNDICQAQLRATKK